MDEIKVALRVMAYETYKILPNVTLIIQHCTSIIFIAKSLASFKECNLIRLPVLLYSANL